MLIQSEVRYVPDGVSAINFFFERVSAVGRISFDNSNRNSQYDRHSNGAPIGTHGAVTRHPLIYAIDVMVYALWRLAYIPSAAMEHEPACWRTVPLMSANILETVVQTSGLAAVAVPMRAMMAPSLFIT